MPGNSFGTLSSRHVRPTKKHNETRYMVSACFTIRSITIRSITVRSIYDSKRGPCKQYEHHHAARTCCGLAVSLRTTLQTDGVTICIIYTTDVTGDHIQQDRRYTQKPIYLAFFTSNTWSYLLCSPVIACAATASCAGPVLRTCIPQLMHTCPVPRIRFCTAFMPETRPTVTGDHTK